VSWSDAELRLATSGPLIPVLARILEFWRHDGLAAHWILQGIGGVGLLEFGLTSLALL
jgi:hypothetical protein